MKNSSRQAIHLIEPLMRAAQYCRLRRGPEECHAYGAERRCDECGYSLKQPRA